MKDKTKSKIKKYTTAAASTVAGEAVGLAMGELLSTEDMELGNSSNSPVHNTKPQLASGVPVEDSPTPISQVEAENVKNEVEVIAVVSNKPDVAPLSSQEAEVVAFENNEDINNNVPSVTMSDEEPELEVGLTDEEPALADSQINEETQNSQESTEEITIAEGDYAETQALPSEPITEFNPIEGITEINPIEGITEAIISADANGMPDYVNNANVDDFMA